MSLDGLDEAFNKIARTLEKQRAKVRQRIEHVTTREQALQQQEQELQRQQALAAAKDAELKDRSAALIAKEQELAEREQQLLSLQQLLHDQFSSLIMLNARVQHRLDQGQQKEGLPHPARRIAQLDAPSQPAAVAASEQKCQGLSEQQWLWLWHNVQTNPQASLQITPFPPDHVTHPAPGPASGPSGPQHRQQLRARGGGPSGHSQGPEDLDMGEHTDCELPGFGLLVDGTTGLFPNGGGRQRPASTGSGSRHAQEGASAGPVSASAQGQAVASGHVDVGQGSHSWADHALWRCKGPGKAETQRGAGQQSSKKKKKNKNKNGQQQDSQVGPAKMGAPRPQGQHSNGPWAAAGIVADAAGSAQRPTGAGEASGGGPTDNMQPQGLVPAAGNTSGSREHQQSRNVKRPADVDSRVQSGQGLAPDSVGQQQGVLQQAAKRQRVYTSVMQDSESVQQAATGPSMNDAALAEHGFTGPQISMPGAQRGGGLSQPADGGVLHPPEVFAHMPPTETMHTGAEQDTAHFHGQAVAVSHGGDAGSAAPAAIQVGQPRSSPFQPDTLQHTIRAGYGDWDSPSSGQAPIQSAAAGVHAGDSAQVSTGWQGSTWHEPMQYMMSGAWEYPQQQEAPRFMMPQGQREQQEAAQRTQPKPQHTAQQQAGNFNSALQDAVGHLPGQVARVLPAQHRAPYLLLSAGQRGPSDDGTPAPSAWQPSLQQEHVTGTEQAPGAQPQQRWWQWRQEGQGSGQGVAAAAAGGEGGSEWGEFSRGGDGGSWDPQKAGGWSAGDGDMGMAAYRGHGGATWRRDGRQHNHQGQQGHQESADGQQWQPGLEHGVHKGRERQWGKQGDRSHSQQPQQHQQWQQQQQQQRQPKQRHPQAGAQKQWSQDRSQSWHDREDNRQQGDRRGDTGRQSGYPAGGGSRGPGRPPLPRLQGEPQASDMGRTPAQAPGAQPHQAPGQAAPAHQGPESSSAPAQPSHQPSGTPGTPAGPPGGAHGAPTASGGGEPGPQQGGKGGATRRFAPSVAAAQAKHQESTEQQAGGTGRNLLSNNRRLLNRLHRTTAAPSETRSSSADERGLQQLVERFRQEEQRAVGQTTGDA